MVIVGGFEANYYPGHIRDVNVSYISGTVASGVGLYGMDVLTYPATLSTTNITGSTTLEVTGSAVYANYYKTKTFYVSAGSFTTHVLGSGMAVNFEGSWDNNSEWYNIKRMEMTSSQKWYYSNTEHHPYVRARISGLRSGATGSWMVNITGTPY